MNEQYRIIRDLVSIRSGEIIESISVGEPCPNERVAYERMKKAMNDAVGVSNELELCTDNGLYEVIGVYYKYVFYIEKIN